MSNWMGDKEIGNVKFDHRADEIEKVNELLKIAYECNEPLLTRLVDLYRLDRASYTEMLERGLFAALSQAHASRDMLLEYMRKSPQPMMFFTPTTPEKEEAND